MQRSLFYTIACLVLGLILPNLTPLLCPAAELRRDAPLDYLVDVWQTDQGLPQGTVNSLVQTADGYLWIGTYNGLARFDGTGFRTLNPANTPSLTSARIVQLYADRRGDLWVGAEEGQVFRMSNGQFTEFHPPSQGSTARMARQMTEDSRGRLWLLNYESNLCHWAGAGFQPSGQGALQTEAGVLAMAVESSGHLWAAAPRSVGTWTDEAFLKVWSPPSGTVIQGATPAQEGGLWVASSDSTRFWLRRITTGGAVAAEHGPFLWPGRPIRSMIQSRTGRIWIGMLGGGVFGYDPGGRSIQIGSRQGLPNPFVTSLCEDLEGNIWVGLQGGGLARLKPALFRKYRQQDGLSAEEVLGVSEGADGELWIGTNGEWLNQIKNGRVEHFDERRGLTHPEVWSVLRDHEGTTWAGTRGGGLFRLKGQAQRFEAFRPPNVEVGFFPGTPLSPIVLGLFEDSRGNLWLGQQTFGTITRITQGEPVLLSVPESPSNFDVRTMGEDRNGAIWIGTHGSGLFRHEEDRFSRYGTADGLRSEFIWALHTDVDGTLWVGTYQGGLSFLQGDRFETLTTQEGLPSDVICQILQDDLGDLWIGSYAGVFRINRRQLQEFQNGERTRVEPQIFTKADGLPSIECTGGFQPSACRLRDGRLCFPTVKGLAVIDPHSPKTNQVPPSVQIEEIWVDGTKRWDSLTPTGSIETTTSATAKTATPNSRTVELSPGQTHLEIRYSGLSFSAPDQVRYRIRLEGIDQQWVDAGNRRHVDYQHLTPGNYRFQVIARNNDHVWNMTGASLAITVRPHFWQTNTFRIAALLILGTGVALAARIMEQRRQQAKLAELEKEKAIEHERLRISQDIHDDLGARLTEITLLSEIVSEEAAEDAPLQKDLQQISSKARDLTRSVDEIVWAVNPSNDNLESLVVYACGYAEDYLRPTQIRCRFDLPPTIARTPMRSDIRHHLFMAFRESMTNVVKHSKATEVTVRFETDGSTLTWSVTDNGQGWPGDQPPPSNRNGMKNMSRRMREIGGSCVAEKAPGGGAQITFRAPLPKEGER
ncbi:MAG: hypothetical protein JNN07_00975 [Verrucomicrobiales bacterium]|nr:hypothetical protein [Verrucomicrobiales bacterium]